MPPPASVSQIDGLDLHSAARAETAATAARASAAAPSNAAKIRYKAPPAAYSLVGPAAAPIGSKDLVVPARTAATALANGAPRAYDGGGKPQNVPSFAPPPSKVKGPPW